MTATAIPQHQFGNAPLSESHAFAITVFRTVCERLVAKADDLRLMAEAAASFEEWLVWEAFLACKHRQPAERFCEVAAKPAYASEGLPDDGSRGGLRVGGPDDGADRCWLFAEFVLLHAGDDWRRTTEDAEARLLRLGWRRSASLLIVVAVNRVASADDPPALTDPCGIALPGGGTAVITAFDVKRDPADTLTGAGR